jgi:putative transposase
MKTCNDKEQKQELKKQKELLKKTTKKEINSEINEFELQTPKEIRAGVIRKLTDNYKVAMKNLRNSNIRRFYMSFKSKKEQEQYCFLSKSLLKVKDCKIQIAPTFLKNNGSSYFKVGKKNKRKLSNFQIKNDCVLVKRNNKYFLCIPVENKITEKRKINPERICGIDPGKRTFLTCYSPISVETFNIKQELLNKLNKKIDILKSLRIKRKSIIKKETKIKNYISEIHNKTINKLVKSYDCIFMGDFESQKVSSKIKNKKNNRYYNNISFYTFKQKLEFKCKSNGVKLNFINEAYTSKTCSCCGVIQDKLGSNEYFKCNNCILDTGRDINASKNILMKGILSN